MKLWFWVLKIANVLVGWAYPAFMSVEAIETKSSADDTQWLTYWLLFALFSITEIVAWPALKWIPLYGVLRLMFLSWLTFPMFSGATVLYCYARPTVVKVVQFVRVQIDSISGQEHSASKKDDDMKAARTKIGGVEQDVHTSLSAAYDEVSSDKSSTKKLDKKLDKIESALEEAPGALKSASKDGSNAAKDVFADIGSALGPA